jgi:hypothetical protein
MGSEHRRASGSKEAVVIAFFELLGNSSPERAKKWEFGVAEMRAVATGTIWIALYLTYLRQAVVANTKHKILTPWRTFGSPKRRARGFVT